MNDVRASKALSQVLRHDPSSIGVTLDSAGWVPIAELLTALERAGRPVTREQLDRVVSTSDKQRFAVDTVTDRIRANQGHSVTVELGLEPRTPPGRLFHGTPVSNLEPILREGLTPQRRHAVHLSTDRATAERVGARRGDYVVVFVDAAGMHRDGYQFTVSDNGVWLTAAVPASYITVEEDPGVAPPQQPDAPANDGTRQARLQLADATAARADAVASTLTGLTTDQACAVVAEHDRLHLELLPPGTPLLMDWHPGRIRAYVQNDRVIGAFAG